MKQFKALRFGGACQKKGDVSKTHLEEGESQYFRRNHGHSKQMHFMHLETLLKVSHLGAVVKTLSPDLC